MISLYTQKQFNSAKSTDKLPCKCLYCANTFHKTKHQIQILINPKQNKTGDFCSNKCNGQFNKKEQTVKCFNCHRLFNKLLSQIKKRKNHFCSSSCSATYNNKPISNPKHLKYI